MYGVAMSTVHIVRALCGQSETALTISSLHSGEYGINDVCLSSLSLVDQHGVKRIITQKLSDDEMRRLYVSSETLKDIIKGIDF